MKGDLVLRGGLVRTFDGERTVSALLVRDGLVRTVGDDSTVSAAAGADARIVELRGKTVVPGLNDAHLHLAWHALSGPEYCVDLAAAGDLAAVGTALASAPDGEWIVGRGWRETTVAEFAAGEAVPSRAWLDEVTGDRPAVLHHASSHSVWANSAALRLAGITAATPDPPAGEIVRDEHGEPTGLLVESAQDLVARLIPKPGKEERLDTIERGMRRLNRLGVTSATDPIVPPELWRDYRDLHAAGRMTVRVTALLHWDWPNPTTSAANLRRALDGATFGGDDLLRAGGIKLFADGVPTHCTAWMHRPYPDGGHGDLVTLGESVESRVDELRQLVLAAQRKRVRVQVHVTGDRAADAVVDAIEAAAAADPWPGARHVLIHGTFLSPAVHERLARLGIGVITSSLMRTFSGPSMVRTVGETQWAQAFPARALLDNGVPAADSSDAPVTTPDWRRGVATFTGVPGPNPYGPPAPADRLSREEALRLWTTGPAWMENAESRKGTLVPGRLADFAVLDTDPVTASHEDLLTLRSVLTVLGGRVVHESEVDIR
ncbi:amidohydrolase [Amycolatopsis sp. CA-230715]|uniref:amidohydrolase n=1 Tax=Amycolatopsis sp. CA-230715 TaxID=2745196 RepID=UPI001C01555D|nr:amidohydrolase [Amycolatopsis sp. CA-230715]QWF86019.1 N-substituted formamide deformylase [Amycolatopsis sp. CA-230715]